MKKTFFILFIAIFYFLAPLNVTLAGANLGQLSIQKTIRNLSHNDGFNTSAEVHIGEEIEIKIEVKTLTEINAIDVVVNDTFPSHLLTYIPDSLQVNGQNFQTGLTSGGLRFGSVSQSPTVITYKAKTIQTGKSENTSNAWAQNANSVSSTTTLEVETATHNNNNNNSNQTSTTPGSLTNSSYLNELEEHMCLHVQNGPDRNISASVNTNSAPDVSRPHTRFIISLPTNGGYASYTPSASGDYIFLINQNIPIKILNSSGAEISIDQGSPSNCSSAQKRIVAELNPGPYLIYFGSGTTNVNLVVEHAEQNIFNPGSSVAGSNTFTAPETGSNTILLSALAFGAIMSIISFLAFRRFN